MKAIKIISGILLLFYRLIAPIAFWGVIGMMIWGTEIWDKPMKGHPSMIYFLIFVPASMMASAWHCVLNDFMPNFAPLIPRKYVGDEQSLRMWITWIQKSKLLAKSKLDALERCEEKLAEQE